MAENIRDYKIKCPHCGNIQKGNIGVSRSKVRFKTWRKK